MTDWLDLSAHDDPRPDEGADYDVAAGAEGLAPGDEWAEPEPVAPEVDEAAVRQWLDLAGYGLNLTLPGRAYGIEDAWRLTADDLAQIAPPLTRIINRHPNLRAVATRADVDAVTVAVGIGRYAWRNTAEVLEARQEAEAERPHIGGRAEAEAPEPAGGLPPGMTGMTGR